MATIRKIPIFTSFLCIFIVGSLSSCGGGGSSAGNGTSGSDVTSAVIGPSGGSLTTKDGNATITIPAGALTTETTITATEVGNAPVVLSTRVEGSAGVLYQFGPAGTVFNSGVTYTFNYDPATLPAGVHKAGLRLAMTGSDFWQLPDTETNDPQNNTVSGSFSQTGTIGVVYVMTAQLDTAQAQAATATTIDSNARGSARLIIDTATNTLQYDLEFAGLSSDETTAHIHGPAASGAPGDVLFDLETGESSGGLINYDEADEQDLLLGLDYIDVHTANYADGELRGQIDRHQIVSPDGLLTLDVPVSDLPPGVDITVRKLDASELPAKLATNTQPVQFAYEFGPDGLTFNTPVPVSIKLADIDSVTSDITTDLTILFSVSGDTIEMLDSQGMDIDNSGKQKRVTGEINHFSKLVGIVAPGINATITGVPFVADKAKQYPVVIKAENTQGSIIVTSSEAVFEDSSEDFSSRDIPKGYEYLGFLTPGNSQVQKTLSYKCDREGTAQFKGTVGVTLGGVGFTQTVIDEYGAILDGIQLDYEVTGRQAILCRSQGSSLTQGNASAAISDTKSATNKVGSVNVNIDQSVQPVQIKETVGNSFDITFTQKVSNLALSTGTRLDMNLRFFDLNPGVKSRKPKITKTTGTQYVHLLPETGFFSTGQPHLAINALTNGTHTQTLQYSCLKAGDTALGLKSDIQLTKTDSKTGPDDFVDSLLSDRAVLLSSQDMAVVIHCTAPSNTGGNATTETGFVNIADGIPNNAVAWEVTNPPIAHTDGPFALPGKPNPDGYVVLDPTDSATFTTSYWDSPGTCDHVHLHGTFQGHGDPEPGKCGHGGLIFFIAQ